MQAGVGCFAHGVQTRHIGARVQVGMHAAAGVVRGWHHWDRVFGDVYAERRAARHDVGEVLA